MGDGPKIPVAEALLRAGPVLDALYRHAGGDIIMAGSIRRGLDEVGDVDVVVTKTNYTQRKAIFKMLAERAEVTKLDRPSYTMGNTFETNGIKVDVLFPAYPEDRYITPVLMFATGSRDHNRLLEAGIHHDGDETDPKDGLWGKWGEAENEEAFYRKFGLTPIAPEHRDDPASLDQLKAELDSHQSAWGDGWACSPRSIRKRAPMNSGMSGSEVTDG